MSMTDPIADYLTRIRNATRAQHSKVDIPVSNMLKEMTRILMEEGYIRNFTIIEDTQCKQNIIRIYLKYGESRKSVIRGIKRESCPGLRHYSNVKNIPRVLNGLGTVILSTPKGILTDRDARRENVGGEVLCSVW
ncbi:30S ribosomal protein S8 [bacterium]|nr:30S ribosomal protein S8 [bacterium]